jgi:hypothetical protein
VTSLGNTHVRIGAVEVARVRVLGRVLVAGLRRNTNTRGGWRRWRRGRRYSSCRTRPGLFGFEGGHLPGVFLFNMFWRIRMHVVAFEFGVVIVPVATHGKPLCVDLSVGSVGRSLRWRPVHRIADASEDIIAGHGLLLLLLLLLLRTTSNINAELPTQPADRMHSHWW